MTADSLRSRILRDSVIIAFIVGVVASVFASSLHASYTSHDYRFIANLVLGALILIIGWLAILLSQEVRYLKKSLGESGIPGCSFRNKEKLAISDVLHEARSEVCFLGISAKRSFSDDTFKDFLSKHSGTAMRVRVLLLDPACDAFARRAQEERESAQSWTQEVAATINKLCHYRNTYGVDIQVRYYRLYPVMRLIIVDNRKLIVNFFLEGRRGTESSQLVFEDSESDVARFFLKWFNAVWQFHSEVVSL